VKGPLFIKKELYMAQDYFKYYKSKFLIILIVYITTLVLWMKNHWGIALSSTTVIGGLIWLIDKYLWKYKPFIWLFTIDNFSGRYEGVIKFDFIDNDGIHQSGEMKHIKLVHQTGSTISVHSFTIGMDGTKSSLSINKGVFIEKTPDGLHYQLVYSYLNNGSNMNRKLSAHFGTDILKFIKRSNGKELSGNYYTNREPQTKGTYLELKWINKDLSHEF
jgi:hypothetical protein